ncbi:unnamed protein product [Periconia digitata]|uniref:Uncharacterized protein n=1 Tax=Periconia digitata TaxID=1303443 RepID=A0A9W4XN64_9PLEO|nr:unnamed protein product [Periconia digitata]
MESITAVPPTLGKVPKKKPEPYGGSRTPSFHDNNVPYAIFQKILQHFSGRVLRRLANRIQKYKTVLEPYIAFSGGHCKKDDIEFICRTIVFCASENPDIAFLLKSLLFQTILDAKFDFFRHIRGADLLQQQSTHYDMLRMGFVYVEEIRLHRKNCRACDLHFDLSNEVVVHADGIIRGLFPSSIQTVTMGTSMQTITTGSPAAQNSPSLSISPGAPAAQDPAAQDPAARLPTTEMNERSSKFHHDEEVIMLISKALDPMPLQSISNLLSNVRKALYNRKVPGRGDKKEEMFSICQTVLKCSAEDFAAVQNTFDFNSHFNVPTRLAHYGSRVREVQYLTQLFMYYCKHVRDHRASCNGCNDVFKMKFFLMHTDKRRVILPWAALDDANPVPAASFPATSPPTSPPPASPRPTSPPPTSPRPTLLPATSLPATSFSATPNRDTLLSPEIGLGPVVNDQYDATDTICTVEPPGAYIPYGVPQPQPQDFMSNIYMNPSGSITTINHGFSSYAPNHHFLSREASYIQPYTYSLGYENSSFSNADGYAHTSMSQAQDAKPWPEQDQTSSTLYFRY